MSTVIRPEISEKNKYWISKHRYYELKHFCLQYPLWKKMYAVAEDSMKSASTELKSQTNEHSDPTAKYALAREYYSRRIVMVETAAKEADSELMEYIIKCVSEGYSYPYLKTCMDIPCSKDTFYDRYRKFFHVLSKIRE